MVVSVIPIGNSCEIRFPKNILEAFSFKDKMDMDMEVTDAGIYLSPIDNSPRVGWKEAFKTMHNLHEDVLEPIPESEDFEWEW